ncbi:MAG: J domain-containing protein [Burkholderiales bacterium]
MTTQKNLFGADAGVGIVTLPKARAAQLTPQQLTFNRLIEKIETLTRALAEHQTVADAHRLRYRARIEPLHRQQKKLHRGMIAFLHGRLQRKGWTRQQQITMREILCGLARPLIAEGDEEMRALHDLYSEDSFEEQQKAVLAEAGAIMEEVLGVPPADGAEFDSVDELWEETMRQANEAEEREQARQARRKPSKRQQKAEKAQQESQATIREIFRKLASTLHPDREPDATERERKTALMTEANAAYARQDLMALLQLQLRIEQIDPAAIGKLSAKKLDSMIATLKEQAKSLDDDFLLLTDQIRMEFGLPWNVAINAVSLSKHLTAVARDFELDIQIMQSDLSHIADDRVFKQWLKHQGHGMEEQELLDLMDVFSEPVARRRKGRK